MPIDRAILGALRVVGALELARKSESQTALRLDMGGAKARASLRRLWVRQLMALEEIGREIAKDAGWDGKTCLDDLEQREAFAVDEDATPTEDLGPLIRRTRRMTPK